VQEYAKAQIVVLNSVELLIQQILVVVVVMQMNIVLVHLTLTRVKGVVPGMELFVMGIAVRKAKHVVGIHVVLLPILVFKVHVATQVLVQHAEDNVVTVNVTAMEDVVNLQVIYAEVNVVHHSTDVVTTNVYL